MFTKKTKLFISTRPINMFYSNSWGQHLPKKPSFKLKRHKETKKISFEIIASESFRLKIRQKQDFVIITKLHLFVTFLTCTHTQTFLYSNFFSLPFYSIFLQKIEAKEKNDDKMATEV